MRGVVILIITIKYPAIAHYLVNAHPNIRAKYVHRGDHKKRDLIYRSSSLSLSLPLSLRSLSLFLFFSCKDMC